MCRVRNMASLAVGMAGLIGLSTNAGRALGTWPPSDGVLQLSPDQPVAHSAVTFATPDIIFVDDQNTQTRVHVDDDGNVSTLEDHSATAQPADDAPSGGMMKDAGPNKNIEAGGPWLGGQFGPVPRPLKAHLRLPEATGHMVLNIVTGSPIDIAGFEQYDVVVRIDDRDVSDNIDAFMDIIRGFRPGESHRFSILRGGERLEKDVIVGNRPEQIGNYKYEVDDDEILQSQTFHRGGILEKDPHGKWELRKFDMKDMPNFQFSMPNLDDLNVQFDWRKDWPGANSNAFTYQSSSGKSVQVERGADGKITVTTTEKTGDDEKTTTQEFANEDELKAGDPEAYKLYKGQASGLRFRFGGGAMPDLSRLHDWMQQNAFSGMNTQMSEDVRKQLEEAQQSLQRLQQDWPGWQQRSQGGAGGAAASPSQTRFEIGQDRAVKVTVREGGQELIYNFANAEAMKTERPDLYKKYEKLQNGGSGGTSPKTGDDASNR